MSAASNPLVTVTAYGRAGASARVRVFEWLDHLGLSATSATYLGGASAGLGDLRRDPAATVAAERRLRTLAASVSGSTVLLGRNATPLSRGGVERALLERAARGVYDFDDALFADPARGAKRAFSKSAVWRAATSAAEVVIAGNVYLADAASELARDVRVIPSCVEPSDYVQKRDFEIGARAPRAVWLGSPSTEQYLHLIEDALLQEHRRSGLTLRVISRGDASLGALDAMIERVDWAYDTFAADLADADVGIMPLPDDPWTRGKCAYKLLQYGAAALPVIGSPVGANVAALRSLGGASACDTESWREELATAIDRPSADRARVGLESRRGVERDYSFAAWEGSWRSAVLEA